MFFGGLRFCTWLPNFETSLFLKFAWSLALCGILPITNLQPQRATFEKDCSLRGAIFEFRLSLLGGAHAVVEPASELGGMQLNA